MRLLAEIKLFGERVVPWSPPRTIKCGKPGKKQWHYHKKDAALIAWQDAIRGAMTLDGPVVPYCGAALLSLTFVKGTPDETLWGKRWWSPKPGRGQADLTNLVKAAEDSIKTWRHWKGAGKERQLIKEVLGVIEEDSQVCDGFTKKRYGPEDGIEIRVYATEDE